MQPWQVGLFIVIPGIVGLLIGRRKGYPIWGLLAGLVVSWLGVLAVALWRTSHDELIRRERERLAVEREAKGGRSLTLAPPRWEYRAVASLIVAVAAAATITACASTAPSADLASPPPTSSQASPPTSPSPAAQKASHHHHHRVTSRQAASLHPGSCNPALWAAIYHPYRLHVIDSCKTVTGRVDDVRYEPDGDVHLLLGLPPSRSGLLNGGNISDTHGDLVVEIICVGTVTQADAESACARIANQVTAPSTGERVEVTGTYVLDADHGWNEIHPVSRLTVLSAPAPVAPPSSSQAAPPPPPPPPAPAGCHPKTPSGGCYEPGEFCSEAEHGETGVAGDGKTITCENTDPGSTWHWV